MKCCSGGHLALVGALARDDRRQAAALAVVGELDVLVVAALQVDLEEAVEGHDLAGGAQADRRASFEPISTVVRSKRAASIWLAIERFQIRS